MGVVSSEWLLGFLHEDIIHWLIGLLEGCLIEHKQSARSSTG